MPIEAGSPEALARAKKAAAARWAEKKVGEVDWQAIPMEEALRLRNELTQELQKANTAIESRKQQERPGIVKCFNFAQCGHTVDVSKGEWAGSRSRHNPVTHEPETAFACSAACDLIMKRDFEHPRANRVYTQSDPNRPKDAQGQPEQQAEVAREQAARDQIPRG